MQRTDQYIVISSEAEKLRQQIADKNALSSALCKTMDLQNEFTVGHIQRDYLSSRGPMTLGVVSHILWRSVRPSLAHPAGEAIHSSIGSNVRYAAAHEFGLDKEVLVKEHTRRNAIRDRYQAGESTVDRFTALRMGLLSKAQVSRQVRDGGKYILAKRGAKQTQSGIRVVIKAHTMHARQKARHYVFNGIKDRTAKYGDALSQTILRVWKEGK